MWYGIASRNQWKREDGLYHQKKWKRNLPIFPSNTNPRNKDPQKRRARQKSPGLFVDMPQSSIIWSCAFFFLIFFIFYFIDLSSLELPYVTPLENKQRKSFTSKALYPLANIPKARAMQKQRCECQEESVKDDSALCPGARLVSDMFDLTVDGKLEDARPLLRVKLLSSSSVPELGHSSGSEGEKEFASPEWDVPLSKTSLRKTRSKSIFLYLSHHSECYAKLCLLFFMQKQIVFSRSPSRPWMQTLS